MLFFKDFYDTPNRAFEKQILLYYICDIHTYITMLLFQ